MAPRLLGQGGQPPWSWRPASLVMAPRLPGHGAPLCWSWHPATLVMEVVVEVKLVEVGVGVEVAKVEVEVAFVTIPPHRVTN